MSIFSQRLIALRKERGLSQPAVAEGIKLLPGLIRIMNMERQSLDCPHWFGLRIFTG